MFRTTFTQWALGILTMLLFFSCISNKKHEAAMLSINEQHLVTLNEAESRYSAQAERLRGLEIKLAEEAGANRALQSMQAIYMQELDSLQNVVVQMNSNALSTQQNLDQNIRQKENEIEILQKKISNAKQQIENKANPLEEVNAELSQVLSSYAKDEVVVLQENDQLKIKLFDKMMFRSGSTRVRTKGLIALDSLAKVLIKYPRLHYHIIGHTDNRKPKGFKDNWDFSALRAAAVTRVLTEDYEVNRNQILAAGKGEFEPNDSNETSEGRAKNRRVEIIIKIQLNNLLKEVYNTLE